MSKNGLVNYVETFFDEYILLTWNEYDFLLWKEMLKTIKNKEHTTLSGLEKIKELRDLQNFYRSNISSDIQKLIDKKLNK